MKRSWTILAVLASITLTACGGRAPGVGANVPDASQQTPGATDSTPAAQPSAYPPSTGIGSDPYSGDPYNSNPPISTQPVGTQPIGQTGPANPPAGIFEVDQGNLVYNWKARGIAVSSGSIYIAAVDNDGLTKNGTVLRMNATTGKDWKDLGTSFLGLSSTLDSTLQGVAIAGGNIFAIDATKGLYSVRTAGNGDVKELKGSGGLDVAGNNNGIFVAANGVLERSDMSGAARTPMPSIRSSGGIGSDSRGNVFFINGNRVGVLDLNGTPRDIIMQGLTTPIDVAADGRNGDVYVLEQTDIKRFNSSGQMVAAFPHGAQQPSSIAVDETGAVYVADFSSDSKIIKFGPADGTQPIQAPGMGLGAGMSYNNYPDPYATGGGIGSVPGYNSGYNSGYNTGYNTGANYGTGYNSGYGTGYNTGSNYGTYNAYAAPQQGMVQPPRPQPMPVQMPQTTNNRRF